MARRCDAVQSPPRDAAAGGHRTGADAPRARRGAGAIQHGIHRHSSPAARGRGLAAGAAAGIARTRRPDHRPPSLAMTKSSGTILDGGSRPDGRGAGTEPRTAGVDNGSADWRPTASREMLRLRAALLARTRSFFAARDVLEVDTPIVVNAPVTDVHLHSATVRLEGT